MPHALAGRGELARGIKALTVDETCAAIISGLDAREALFDLAFFGKALENCAQARISDRPLLKFDEGVVHLVRRNGGRDPVDMSYGQGKPFYLTIDELTIKAGALIVQVQPVRILAPVRG